jgi:transposase
MAAGKKNAARLGAHLVFLDESGFLLIPTVRKTWSPRGQTPVFRHRQGQRKKISAISGISVSPVRHRLNLYFQLHRKNIQQAEVCEFLRYWLRHLRGPVIVLLDNLSAHGGKPIRALCDKFPRLHLERFPAYAPELNPDEGIWHLAKARLANGCPDTQDELLDQVSEAMRTIANSPAHLRGCVKQTPLPLF